jgi:putative OPT family oligopeptide transporter
VCIAVFAFFFVTVSSRIVGLVGVTSNPTSGMAIATLLGTSLVFLLAGWTDTLGKATALMVGTAVCIAASIAGDTSQDLKTGFILGATPYRQQIGELIGVLTSAGFVCLVVIVLNDGTPGGLGGPELPAPQAVLMKLVVDGVLDQSLPWGLIFIGVGIAAVAALLRVPTLPFAVGVYLPLSTMGAVFLGGLLRWYLARRRPTEVAESRRERGILFGSGLVGGGGLTGVLLAVWVVAVRDGRPIVGFPPAISDPLAMVLAAVVIAAGLGAMAYHATRRDPST